MEISRRALMIGAAAGGGLLVAWALTPRSFPLPLTVGEGEQAFGPWLKIARDGVVTVAVPQLEMGQGITTILPQIVALELGADWRQVAVEPAAISGAYANAPLAARWAELWMPAFSSLADAPNSWLARRFAEDNRLMVTADGTALAAYEAPARGAAASARAVLAMAAAARWDVDWEDCEAAGGFIRHGDKRLPFGALVDDAARYDPPGRPVLRASPAFEKPSAHPPGAPLAFPRIDLPAKVDGSMVFAGDVRLPDMLHAAIRHAPAGEAKLGKYDAAAAKAVPGYVALVEGEGWLAAVGSDWWAAERALREAAPRFRVNGPVESSRIEAALDNALRRGKAHRVSASGEPGLLSGDFSHAARYDVAPALHATLETASVTARLRDGRLELWLASQAPEAARWAAGAAVGLSAGDVVLYPMPAGGSFDRRLEHQHAVEAAVIAHKVGRPVQLTWSRWQEHVAAIPRPPVAAALAARTTPDGSVIAWKARIAVPSSTREFGRRLFDGSVPREAMLDSSGNGDALAIEGAVPPYAIPHLVIEHVPAAIGLPTGRMRGNAHGYTAFFTECFVDELAHEAGREPLSFRMAMLGGDLRLAQCLQRAATLAQWNGGADGSGQGIAVHRMGPGEGDGRIAVVATARRDEHGVRVDRLSAVADLGRIVNLDIARQQIEGGLVFGLGLAVGSSTGYDRGLPSAGRLSLLGLPLLADCPEIDVELVDSPAPPADPGELGVAVVAPAIANALFSAIGLRLRKLPLLSEEF